MSAQDSPPQQTTADQRPKTQTKQDEEQSPTSQIANNANMQGSTKSHLLVTVLKALQKPKHAQDAQLMETTAQKRHKTQQ